jgi:hypothetical protein
MLETKRCFKCSTMLPIDFFYKHPQMADGRLNKCKQCTKRDTKENRAKNADHYREYDIARGSLDHRVEARAGYQKSDVGRAAASRARIRSDSRFPDRRRARITLGNAVRDGRIAPSEACWSCGSTNKIEGHHADYSNHLGVIWLCRKCHVQAHKETEAYIEEIA